MKARQLFPCGQIAAPAQSRREFLQQTALGFGSLALASLAAPPASAANPLAPRAPHFQPRAKRVIMLYLHGGHPQQETFDPKPEAPEGVQTYDVPSRNHVEGIVD